MNSPYNTNIWNINNSKYISRIEMNEWVSSGCFAKGKKDVYVIVCVYNGVKIFDLSGKFISNIKFQVI